MVVPMEDISRAVEGSPLAASDSRPVHVVTRGNVDGIVSSAFCLVGHPRARLSYVPSGSAAVDVLRKDLSSSLFYLVDLGLTPKLIKTLNLKRHTSQSIVLLDHHQQTARHAADLGDHVLVEVSRRSSAATVTLDHLGLEDPALTRLAALADVVEYCESPYLVRAIQRWGPDRILREAQHLDYAWRLQVEDDRFRATAARRLSQGFWPSEVPEVRRRYQQMLSEDRWLRAKDRVRSHLVIRNGVALLEFGKRKPSLLGFGSRALTAVAREDGARLAVLVNRHKEFASIALRKVGRFDLNLGLFVEDFTRDRGVVGGGHPTSAGAKIHARHLPTFLSEIHAHAKA